MYALFLPNDNIEKRTQIKSQSFKRVFYFRKNGCDYSSHPIIQGMIIKINYYLVFRIIEINILFVGLGTHIQVHEV